MKRMVGKRILSLLLCAMLLLGLLPTTAFATGIEDGTATETMEQENLGDIPVDENSPDSEDESTPPETDTSETPAELEEPDVEEEPVENKLEVMSAPVGGFVQSQLSLVSDKQSTLAAGVTQDIYTVYDKNGKQVKMFVATVDPSVDTVKMFTSYKDMDNSSYGMSKLTEQVAAFDKKAAAGDPYYTGTVVAGINASYYNMTNGKPSGVFVMNGNDVTGGERSAYFAVLKDGTVKIGNASDYEADKGNIQEALGIYKMLVFDGNIVLSDADKNSTEKYPRQTIGITGDGKVILLSADGNQEPESAGLTLMEQAQVMLDLGCVYAGHLDGGGSMTYGSKPEGEDAFKIVNKPSDGSERSISNGFIVVSTAVASKTFDHVKYDVETEYATVGTPVSVSVSGVSSTGHEAEIPADITYSVTNGTYEDGVLTAAAVGDVVLTAVHGGKDVGSVTIHAVVPQTISFSNKQLTVPFGETVPLDMTATYDLNKVKFKASDFEFVLSDDGIGSVNGFEFTAGDGTVTEATLTALLSGTDLSAETSIVLGKGSEVLWDFEEGEQTNVKRARAMGSNSNYLDYKQLTTFSIVTAENGMVHSGNNALKMEIDFSSSMEMGFINVGLNFDLPDLKDGKSGKIDLTGATRLGMWIYFSNEAYSLEGSLLNDSIGVWKPTSKGAMGTIDVSASKRPVLETKIDDGQTWLGGGYATLFDEPGWHYVYVDIPDCTYVNPNKPADVYNYGISRSWKALQLTIHDRDNSSYGYDHTNFKSVNQKVVLYIDDITIDYSTATADRDAPVFKSVRWADTRMSDSADFTRGVVAETTGNVLSFSATVDDFDGSNATGLDETTAKAYVDGVEIPVTIKNGIMAVADCVLADGIHTVKFSICDKQGNYASVIRQVNVNANSGKSTVKLVAHDATLNNILLGSVYYMDLVATDIEMVQSVSADINLNNMSRWELDHMNVAEGFTASYVISDADENIATITVTRTGSTSVTGEGMLVSMPVRTWELPAIAASYKHKGEVWMYPEYRSSNEVWPIDISASVVRGEVDFVDGTTDTFTGSEVQVDTEAHYWTSETKPADYASWNGGHDHRAETKQYYASTATNHVDAVALPDKAATCTEAGYTGRTFCEVCNSVVDWGTTIPATGHSYALTDGVLKCSACGTLFNGVWTDGKEYVDGVSTADGWHGTTYYYQNGQKLTGIQKVMAPDESGEFYYNFGEDGKSQGKYTGLVQIKEQWYFSKVGVLTGGWQQIEDNWHYFRSYTKSAVTGEYTVNGVTYQFDETGMTKGAWHTDENGTRYYYGPSFYQARNPGYMALYEIDGKTYNFGNDGYLTYGVQVLQDAASLRKRIFEFDGTTGALVKRITDHGVYTMQGGTMYYINADGEVPMNAGLVQFDGSYYFVLWSGKVVANADRMIQTSQTNNLLPAGTYHFGPDGKMVMPDTTTGIVWDGDRYVYKINGEIQKSAGLVEIDGAYYFVCYSGKLKQSGWQTITETNANGLMEPGVYYFGDDCKMIVPDRTTGIVQDGDRYVYKIDGKIQTGTGLIEVDGAYYFVCYSGKLKQSGYQTITEANANDLAEPGVYYFGDDCKMVRK